MSADRLDGRRVGRTDEKKNEWDERTDRWMDGCDGPLLEVVQAQTSSTFQETTQLRADEGPSSLFKNKALRFTNWCLEATL